MYFMSFVNERNYFTLRIINLQANGDTDVKYSDKSHGVANNYESDKIISYSRS